MGRMLPRLQRTGRDLAYLTLGLLTGALALVVWIVSISVSLSLTLFVIGIPVVIGCAFAMRWTAELDRRNAALVFGRPVRGYYRSHGGRTWWARFSATATDPQVWRDLAWLITHSVLGLAFGIIAISLVASVAGLATLPAWYWSLPQGRQFGLWNADSLPLAFASALLAIPLAWVTVYALRGMARVHAALAAELLGRY
jgi:hypothetical protein